MLHVESGTGAESCYSLPLHDIMSEVAGEVWYASSVLGALLLFGFAIFLVLFGALPYWFKLHKHLNEILGCKSQCRSRRLCRLSG